MQITCVRNNHAKKIIKPMLAFLEFLLVNQDIHAQLCTHVKNQHHYMNYLIFDY
jgi:hypothetical protein